MPEFCTRENTLPGLPDEAMLEVRLQIYGADLEEGEHGELFITPFMITPDEVDYHISRIIEQLKRVGDQAKARLSENCQEPSDSN